MSSCSFRGVTPARLGPNYFHPTNISRCRQLPTSTVHSQPTGRNRRDPKPTFNTTRFLLANCLNAVHSSILQVLFVKINDGEVVTCTVHTTSGAATASGR